MKLLHIRKEKAMSEKLGERLTDLLRTRKLTQKDLSMKAGVTEAAISHYIKGDRVPRASVLARIADALGTTSEYLLTGTAVNHSEEIIQAKRLIARNASQMSREEKMEIVSLLLGED